MRYYSSSAEDSGNGDETSTDTEQPPPISQPTSILNALTPLVVPEIFPTNEVKYRKHSARLK
jgi:hypothetical protein